MSDRMSPVDAAWLRMDQPTNLMVITTVLWFDEVPDWDLVVDTLHGRIVERYPRFRQRAIDDGIGLPRWEDDPLFDIALHVQRVALPAPGDDATLKRFVGDVMSRDLDRRRPLWHTWLVEGWGDGAALVMRIHHSVADGISLASVLLSMVDGAPTPPDPPNGRNHLLDLAQTVLHTAGDVLVHPSRLVGAARTGVGIIESLLNETLMSADAQTVFRGPQSARKVVAWSPPLPLAAVKEAAHARDATVNDVMLAALSGALGRYLDDAGTPAERVRALVPVNLRPPDQAVPVTLGNHFALVLCPLHVGISDPIDRLAAVKQSMDAIKSTPEAITSFGLLASMGVSPPAIEDVMVNFFGDKASMVVTNVPGPRGEVRLAGSPVAGMLSWAPQSGPISMSISIISYDGMVRVGVATDPALVPDPDRIAGAIAEEVAALAVAIA